MATEANLTHFDPAHPRHGAAVKAKVNREQLENVATSNASPIEPTLSATIIGDKKFSGVDLRTRKKVKLTIDSQGPHEIDLTWRASNNASVTPSEIVDAINLGDPGGSFNGFASLFSGSDVAFTYDVNAADSSAFVLLRSTTSGTTSSITADRGTGSEDALDLVFGLDSRKVTIPLSVTGTAPPAGYQWYQTDTGDDDGIHLYVDSPAKVVGFVDLTTTVNLSVLRNLRITITISEGTFGPHDVDCQGGSPGATTGTEIRDAINTLFSGLANWPSANGPASLVTRNGSGSYLQIVSGPFDDPQTGPTVSVKISEPTAGAPIVYGKDDAAGVILGLALGEGANKQYSRIPHTFTGSRFASHMVRGVNERSGPGIGPWGKMLDEKKDIPLNGVVDGEVRVDRAHGVPWIYREGQDLGLLGTSTGWRRALPSVEYPMDYDRTNERYTLQDVTKGVIPYVPEPHTELSSSNLAKHFAAGSENQVPTLVDARDSRWIDERSGTDDTSLYPRDANSGAVRHLYTDPNRYDYFAKVSTGTTPPIFPSAEGGVWVQSGSNLYSNGVEAVTSNANDTADRAYYSHPVGHIWKGPVGDGSTTVFTFQIDSPAIATSGGIAQGSFHLALVDSVDNSIVSLNAFDDNGSGDNVSIVGTGISSGTLRRAAGLVEDLTFSVAPTGSQQIVCAFSLRLTEQIVCVQVKKDAAAQGGNVAEAGVLYGARHDSLGAIDSGSGFLCIVRDDGTGAIQEVVGGTATPIHNFNIDPPLDTTYRTLRVLLQGTTHTVFWNGSENRSEWFGREGYLDSDRMGDIAGQPAPVGGGNEITWNTQEARRVVVRTFQGGLNLAPWPVHGQFAGIYAMPRSASGGYSAKHISLRNFQCMGGQIEALSTIYPGLPPVSAVRTRDSIHTVRLQRDGVDYAGLITDCNHQSPLKINCEGGLASSTLDALGRTINLRLGAVQGTELDAYWTTSNLNGAYALWKGPSADPTATDLATLTPIGGITKVSGGAGLGDLYQTAIGNDGIVEMPTPGTGTGTGNNYYETNLPNVGPLGPWAATFEVHIWCQPIGFGVWAYGLQNFLNAHGLDAGQGEFEFAGLQGTAGQGTNPLSIVHVDPNNTGQTLLVRFEVHPSHMMRFTALMIGGMALRKV